MNEVFLYYNNITIAICIFLDAEVEILIYSRFKKYMCSSRPIEDHSVSSLAKSGRVSVVALVVALLETQHVPHLRMRLHARHLRRPAGCPLELGTVRAVQRETRSPGGSPAWWLVGWCQLALPRLRRGPRRPTQNHRNSLMRRPQVYASSFINRKAQAMHGLTCGAK
jgi:hypothetical protein